jgi:hypothetical protein
MLFANGDVTFQFRDAKKSTGLKHCQARELDKLHFHFNSTLSTGTITKIIQMNNKNKVCKSFIISGYKLLYNNAFL